MGRADYHIHHANLVFHLADHDAGFASVGRHPMQNSGRRAHGVGAIKFHARGCAAHGHCNVATQHSVVVRGHRKRPGKRSEIRGGIVIADSRKSDVFRHNGFAFFFELLSENLLQDQRPLQACFGLPYSA